MADIRLNIYEDDMSTVAEVVEANLIKISFGTVRKLMGLFGATSTDNKVELLNVVVACWDDLIKILDRVFPGMTEDDWDHVAVDELAGAIWLMLKSIGAEIAKIPTESKN